MTNALFYLGHITDSMRLESFKIKIELEQKHAPKLGIGLLSYAGSLLHNNQLEAPYRTIELTRALVENVNDTEGTAWCHLYLLGIYRDTGQWAAGENLYAKAKATPPQARTALWHSSLEQYRAMMHISQGFDATQILAEAKAWALEGQDALGLRRIHQLYGEIALQKGSHAKAAEHFLEALTPARKSGGFDTAIYSGRLAVTRALQGQNETAYQLTDELLRYADQYGDKIHRDIAEVYLVLGEHEKAAEHAIIAYKVAWAEGPPFIWWWNLEHTKRILAALGIDPPDMPPFDPANVEPIPYEDEIRAFIEELRAKKED